MSSGGVTDVAGPAMELREQRQLAREDARRRVLAAASALFARAGEEALSMRKVAQAAGCSAAGLYLLFRDRAALLDALLEASREELREVLAEAALAPRAERAVAVARAYVRWALVHPAHFEQLFVRPPRSALGGRASSEQAAVLDRAVTAALDEALEAAFGTKKRRERAAVRAARAAIYGVVTTALRHGLPRAPALEGASDEAQRRAAIAVLEDDAALLVQALSRELRR